jgi:hypothetical protein
MIVTETDIAALRDAIDRYASSWKWIANMRRAMARDGALKDPKGLAKEMFRGLSREQLAAIGEAGRMEKDDILGFLRRNHHLLLPCGFDEIRIERSELDALVTAMSHAFRERFGDVHAPPDLFSGQFGASIFLSVGLRLRDEASGVWYRNLVLDHVTRRISVRSSHGTKTFSLEEILRRCERALHVPNSHPAAIVLPDLWRPPSTSPSIELVEATRAVLTALKAGKTTLREITWEQLEDVVGELMRQRGYEVQMGRRRKDGGRDMIVRGELIPGHACVLAVEVRQRAVVGLDQLRSRLYANRKFPALVFATSGRFTAGVVREKRDAENYLRLFLHDGKALGDWIREYR